MKQNQRNTAKKIMTSLRALQWRRIKLHPVTKNTKLYHMIKVHPRSDRKSADSMSGVATKPISNPPDEKLSLVKYHTASSKLLKSSVNNYIKNN